jgi:hypothetical protein
MIKKLILTAVLMLSITMVSCSTKTQETPSSSNSSDTAEQNIDKNTSSDTESDKKAAKSTQDATANKIKLSIYSINENSLEPNESGSIQVSENLSLENKLKELSKALSEKNFNKLPIEVKSIDTINGKKVATINLTDSADKKWSQKFQGSTGGSVTANALVENFLQSNNKSKGEWIDGVKFLYNNKTIEYEHVANLSNIQYRN